MYGLTDPLADLICSRILELDSRPLLVAIGKFTFTNTFYTDWLTFLSIIIKKLKGQDDWSLANREYFCQRWIPSRTSSLTKISLWKARSGSTIVVRGVRIIVHLGRSPPFKFGQEALCIKYIHTIAAPRYQDWNFTYVHRQSVRFPGNGFSLTECDKTPDLVYYLCNHDDSPFISRRKVTTFSNTMNKNYQGTGPAIWRSHWYRLLWMIDECPEYIFNVARLNNYLHELWIQLRLQWKWEFIKKLKT